MLSVNQTLPNVSPSGRRPPASLSQTPTQGGLRIETHLLRIDLDRLRSRVLVERQRLGQQFAVRLSYKIVGPFFPATTRTKAG
jgi:hypothetical protein